MKCILALVFCLLLTACTAPQASLTAEPSAVPAQPTDGGRAQAVVRPEGLTDPADIVVDDSVLTRADGKMPFADASSAAAESAEAQAAFDVSTWPLNDATQGLPMPAVGRVSFCGEIEEMPGAYTIVFEALPYETFLTYIESLKQAGFTQDAATEDYTAYGMEGIAYSAMGADGRSVEAVCVGGSATLTIIQ